MPIIYLIPAIIGFLSSIIFIVLFKKPALKYKIFVSEGVPLIGGASTGLAFFLACFFGLLLFRFSSIQIKGIIFASTIMLIFGLLDDWRELSILAKFLVQLIAALLLIAFGIRTYIVGIGHGLNIIITLIWIIGITNAFNHLDVMDGLSAGVAIIVSLAFFIISFLNNDINTLILSLSLIGAVFGFLIYNLPPAKVYMGNSGSHFLGFVLSSIALVISYAPLERKVALFSPLLILGLPIFDTAFLILARIGKKKLPFKKSNDHLALKFVALGYSKKKVLFVMLGYGLFFSICGLMVARVSNLWGTIIIISTFLLSLSVIKKASKVTP